MKRYISEAVENDMKCFYNSYYFISSLENEYKIAALNRYLSSICFNPMEISLYNQLNISKKYVPYRKVSAAEK